MMINQIPGLLELCRRGEEWRCEGLAGSLFLLTSSMGFAGDYLAFAGVGCSLVREAGADRRRREKEARLSELSSRCFLPARPSLAGEKNGSEAAPDRRLVFAADRWPAPFAASPELLGE
ncbi:hypothetical protein H5410_035691 [Solanum commersonii]|uniref:Uncharacterized protein n=1 Tax=Solanum commersonii TaxID=4109 RepID=A0A9J5Y1E2_SOLCO|nr:hypothetical protein H5410_035691 [Solanum commersonii]